MTATAKILLTLGGLNAMLAVLLGAFGAHALKARLTPDLMAAYQTGNQYHFYHALGLLLIGLVAIHMPSSSLIKWSAGVMLVGLLLFSGSLYLLGASGMRWLGMITPVGGMALIIAWLLFALSLWRV